MGSDIVILDEPTSSSSCQEKETLFKVDNRLRRAGQAIIYYITHFLGEVLELCDKFVVLRNGQLHGQGAIKDVTNDDIIRLIIGRDVAMESAPQREAKGDVALKVEKIRSPSSHRIYRSSCAGGKILRLWGLMGSGRTELVRAILGLDPIEGGSLFLAMDDRMVRIQPRKLLSHCGYAEDRHSGGLFLISTGLEKYYGDRARRYVSKVLRFLNVREELKASKAHIESLRIATGQGPYSRTETLSGGNQQKVIFAKWLNQQSGLVLDEPTRR